MSEGLNKKLEEATLEDEVELPEELKNLIEETVGNTKDVKEVTAEMLSGFFENASEKIKDEAILPKLEEAVKDLEDRQAKLDKIKEGLNPIYESVWASFGVDYELGKNAISHHREILQNETISPELRQALVTGIQTFSKTEQNLVRRILMGKELYEKELEQEGVVEKVRKELFNDLNTMSAKERGVLISTLKDKGTTFRERMKNMGQEEAIEYLKNPSDEDQELLYKLSALTMILGGGENHGHSHNGQPCGGHGHAAPPPEQHGHSHNGQPCGGHGAPAPPPQQHGHSHNGQPCGGHGAPAPPPPQQHGHSHNGKACHGHGN